MMSGPGINPIFFNKKKIGRLEHSLTSNHTHISQYLIFALPPLHPCPPHSSQSGCHMCISPYIFDVEHSNNTVCLFLNAHQIKEKRNP